MQIDENLKRKNQIIMLVFSLVIIVFAVSLGLILSKTPLSGQMSEFKNWLNKAGDFLEKEFSGADYDVDSEIGSDLNINLDINGENVNLDNSNESVISKESKIFSFSQTVSSASETIVSYNFDIGNLEVGASEKTGIISGEIKYSGKSPTIDYKKSYTDQFTVISRNNQTNNALIYLPKKSIPMLSVYGGSGNIKLNLEKTAVESINVNLDAANLKVYLPEIDFSSLNISLETGNIELFVPKNCLYEIKFAQGAPDFDFGPGYTVSEKEVKDKRFDDYSVKIPRINIYINQSTGDFSIERF